MEYEPYGYVAEMLARARRSWRTVNIAEGALVYASALLGTLLAALAVECLSAETPVWLRRALGLAVAAVGALGLGYWVLWRMMQDRTDEDLALMVERAFPAIDNGLINAVRLAKEEWVASPGMVAAGMWETLRRAEGWDAALAVDRRRVKLLAVGAAGLATCVLAMVALMPGRVANAARRLLAPGANVAKVGSVKILSVEPGDRVGKDALVSGETLAVEVKTEPIGLREIEGVLSYREKPGEPLKSHRLRMVSNEGFRAEVREVKTGLEYQARVGDSASRFYRVEVVEPPAVTGIEIEYVYPAYTGEEPKTVKDSDGTVRAVAGTEFGMRVSSSRGLEKAFLRLDEQEEAPLSPEPGGKWARLAKRMKIERDRSYTIHLKDESGFENRDPVQRHIKAVPDAKPTVTIAQPGKDEVVAPGDRMALVARASDDYGLGKAALMGRLRRNNEEGKDAVIYEWPQVPEGKKVVLSWDWIFDPKSYQSGDVVRYYIIVEDNNSVTGPGVGKSSEFEVRVRDPEKVKQEQAEKYDSWQAELEKVLREQTELRRETGRLEQWTGTKEGGEQRPETPGKQEAKP